MNLEPIDTSTTAGKAEVMRLAAEGRNVVYRKHGIHGVKGWSFIDAAGWDWKTYLYAIIAEPVGPNEVWIQQRNGALWAYPEDREGSIRYVRAEE
ncbi:hypothetical protein [Stenotrophomonas phage SOVA965]